MFEIFKKKTNKAPSWKELTSAQRADITKKIMNMAGAHYRIVQGPDQLNREQGLNEVQNEDFYLNQYRRGRLLDLTRNAVRNSATFNTILKQFDYNVVGTKGGKAIINFDDYNLSKELKEKFSYFTRQADFFDGFNFNTVLKLIMKTELIGGDCVILFDDGLIEDSGKLLIYESDEIGNTSEEAIKDHYGKNAIQSQGKVYNENGRWIGTVVSRSCRGMSIFDPDKCYFLKRDPDVSYLSSKWIMPSNVWRINQGRGITQSSSALGSILDLEDLTGFELQSAKKNSQTFAQIYNTNANNEESQIPSAFDTETDFDNMTAEEMEAAVKEEQSANEKIVSFQKAQSCGIVYEQLPDNFKMELLDTKHPNQNMQEFIEWIAGRSSAVFGLSRSFATGNPTGQDFRAQQLMTQPAFDEWQKHLEQICDWCLYRYAWWADRKEIFNAKSLPENWLKYVDWAWPELDDVDEVAKQKAIQMKLSNCTGTLRETLGSDWKYKMEQIKEEIDFCKKNGIPHPSFAMKSGGERSESEIAQELVEKEM